MPEEMRVDDGGGRERTMRVDYPSNSSKKGRQPAEQPEEKKVETVVTGQVVRRKRSPFARLAHGFIAEDSGSIFEHIVQDVLIPAARTMIYDMFTQGLERTLWGDSKPRSTTQRGYTNYSAKDRKSTRLNSSH